MVVLSDKGQNIRFRLLAVAALRAWLPVSVQLQQAKAHLAPEMRRPRVGNLVQPKALGQGSLGTAPGVIDTKQQNIGDGTSMIQTCAALNDR